MSVGYPQGKTEIDQRAGSVVLGVRQALQAVNDFNTYLTQATVTDSFLVGLGYSQAEVNTLRAGITDLTNLYKIAHAAGTQASANDFFFNAGKLTGVI